MLIRTAWVALMLATVAATPVSAATEYRVRHDATGQALYVRACFDSGRGISLRAASNQASDYLMFARDGEDRPVSVNRNRMYLPRSQGRRCIRYGVDLDAITANAGMRSGFVIGDTRISWSGMWLWRPSGSLEGATLSFQHARGVSVSAPWPLIERGPESTHYRFDATPGSWSNLVAIGRFTPRSVQTPGGELRAAILSGDRDMDEDKLVRWLDATVAAVSQIYGSMPLASPQVLVAPINRGNGPVPWAQVQRGGGTAVHLFVNPEHDLETFVSDWTASHEFSHLFHPYMGGGGRWFAEGLASYYQNVSRARSGQLSDDQAWKKLHAGFGRGKKDADHLTLRQVNQNIRQGRYMRVYWSGAAIALIADVQLRRESGGHQSLDTVLAEFAACHLPASRMWRIDEMMSTLDQLAGRPVFEPLYRRYIDNPRFPDLDATYQALGLIERRGRLAYSDRDDQAVELRTGLMGQSMADRKVASCDTKRKPLS